MIEFSVYRLNNILTLLRGYAAEMERSIAATGPQTAVDDQDLIQSVAQNAEVVLESIGLDDAAILAAQLCQRLTWTSGACNCQLVLADIEHILTLTELGLGKHRFAYVPIDRHRFFENDNPFNLPSCSLVDSVKQDFRDAGNAYAMGLNTATVFHLMRATEIGLRAFARHLRVRMPRKKGPLEWAQWEDILRQIRLKIDKKSVKAGSKPAKSANRAFYRGLLAEFEGFKDMYRNDVMHVRKVYGPHDAAGALEKVGGFMQRLASRLHA